jgi:hypothetical protein
MKKFTTYLILVIATVCNSVISYGQRGGEVVIDRLKTASGWRVLQKFWTRYSQFQTLTFHYLQSITCQVLTYSALLQQLLACNKN